MPMLLAIIAAMLRVVLLLDPPTGGSGSGSGSGDGSGGSGSGDGGGGGSGSGGGSRRSRAPQWDDPPPDDPGAIRNAQVYGTQLDTWRERARNAQRTIEDMEREHAAELERVRRETERATRESVTGELQPQLRAQRVTNAILQHAGGRFVDLDDAARELSGTADEWLGDDGAVDEGKLVEAMDGVLTAKPHYRHPEYDPDADGKGGKGGDGGDGTSNGQQQRSPQVRPGQGAGAPRPGTSGGAPAADPAAIAQFVQQRTGIKVRKPEGAQ